MVFVETTTFTRFIGHYLTDDEYWGLQMFLVERPDAGQIIRGTGGVRKLRWAAAGKGKSGGVRIIYFWQVTKDKIWMLTIYSKSERETIPAHILSRIAEEIGHD